MWNDGWMAKALAMVEKMMTSSSWFTINSIVNPQIFFFCELESHIEVFNLSILEILLLLFKYGKVEEYYYIS
jgi:hypothetical protein